MTLLRQQPAFPRPQFRQGEARIFLWRSALLRACLRQSGRNSYFRHPGLTPWATLCRPYPGLVLRFAAIVVYLMKSGRIPIIEIVCRAPGYRAKQCEHNCQADP